MKKMKLKFGANIFTVLAVYGLLILTAALGREVFDIFSASRAVKTNQVVVEKTADSAISSTSSAKEPLMDKAVLNVPYTVQAPLANWNIHEESCEEAGILMMHYYLLGASFPNNVITREKANSELTEMVNWQKNHYGKEADLTMTMLGGLAKDYYGSNFEVKKNITAEDIKTVISAGHPVIVPVMTQVLQNPHYSSGNVYHVLLIKGYDQTGVITNDSGVKEGQNYHYTWSVLWQAIDAQKAKMGQGRDMLIVNN